MYPEFIEVAKRQTSTAAVRTFTYARKVDAVHAVLYQDRSRTSTSVPARATPIMSVPDCGNRLEQLNVLKCLVCGHAKSGFVAVS
jgi:rubrerythrin